MEPIGNKLKLYSQQIEEKNEAIQEILKQYPKELVEQAIQRMDRILAQEILTKKRCPLIGKKGWKCGTGLRNGEETWCKNTDYINCGAFDRYFLFILSKSMKEKRTKKER
jgi:hypothetical protein